MDDPEELALVVRALTSGLSDCVCWINDRAGLRIRNNPDLKGLTPEGIKRSLISFVKRGGEVRQVVEKRSEYRDFRFYYKAVLPISGFVHGVFVEFVLIDDDREYPGVALVNAHPQRS